MYTNTEIVSVIQQLHNKGIGYHATEATGVQRVSQEVELGE